MNPFSRGLSLETVKQGKHRGRTARAQPERHVLERSSEKTLHEQIADQLRSEISSRLRTGDQIPTEVELSQTYGVGRSTIRKAMDALIEQRLLVRRQGKGTFVVRPMPQIVYPLDELKPFAEVLKQNAGTPEVKIVDYAWVGSDGVPANLRDVADSAVTYSRLYLMDGTPHALVQVAVPEKIGRNITRADVETMFIYDILRKKLKLEPHSTEFIVSCQTPTRSQNEMLRIPASAYVLVVTRLTRDRDGNPLETTTHILRSDVYKLSVSTCRRATR